MSERQLPTSDALFDQAPCGLVLTDPDGRIQRVNATFCQWLGYVAGDLVQQRRIQDLLSMGGRVFHQTHWAPLMQIQGSVAEVKFDAVHRDGHKIPMLLNAVRRRHGTEFFHELALVIVHDRQKYERELMAARANAEASQKQLTIEHQRKDEFLATLAHELRNPLAPMRNVVQILKLLKLEDSKLVWARDVLGRQIEQMAHLVDDLMEISRISQGKVDLRMQRVELSQALTSAIEAATPFIETAGHELTVSLPKDPLFLLADSTRLVQMVLNLLNNAAKYTPDGGRIWLTAKAQGSEIVISVRDSGVGISAQQLPSVFEMFSQITPALQRTEGGLGIGLALVKGLVELHGGSVSAFSEGAEKGSEFVLRLPLIELARDSPARMSQSPSPLDSLRIVVVDDNLDAAESMAMLLEEQGHLVRTASDGLAALKLANAFSPDVLLLDLGLPGIDGLEVARRLRAKDVEKRQLLVAITGWGQTQDKAASKGAGFDHHLTKPIQLDELDSILATLAGMRGDRANPS